MFEDKVKQEHILCTGPMVYSTVTPPHTIPHSPQRLSLHPKVGGVKEGEETLKKVHLKTHSSTSGGTIGKKRTNKWRMEWLSFRCGFQYSLVYTDLLKIQSIMEMGDGGGDGGA